MCPADELQAVDVVELPRHLAPKQIPRTPVRIGMEKKNNCEENAHFSYPYHPFFLPAQESIHRSCRVDLQLLTPLPPSLHPSSPWRDHPRVSNVFGVAPHHIAEGAVVGDLLDPVDGADLEEGGREDGRDESNVRRKAGRL